MISATDLEAHRRLAYHNAFKVLRNREDAEDVVQQALIGVWMARERVRPETLLAYLKRAVCRKALDLKKSKCAKINAMSFDEANIEFDPHEYLADPRDRYQEMDSVAAAEYLRGVLLAELTPIQAAAWTRFADGEAGTRITDRTRIHRARQKLARVFPNLAGVN
jgi:RNA polymerase sigma factor (sigma-70 family)